MGIVRGVEGPWGRGRGRGRGRDADVGGGARGRAQVSRAAVPFVPSPPAPHPSPQSPLGASPALAPRAGRTAAGGVFGPGQVRLGSILGRCAGHLWRPQEQRFRRPARPWAGERVRGQLRSRPCWGEGGWDGRCLPFLRPGAPLLTSPCTRTLRIPAPAQCSAPRMAASLLLSLVSLPFLSPLSRLLCPSSHFSILCPGPRLILPPPLFLWFLVLPFLQIGRAHV